ncbi:hypothetical protein MCEREM21A_01821 [Sphingomonadaceae bacterium]
MAVGEGRVKKRRRLSVGTAGLAALLITISGGPVAACVVAGPPSCEATESQAACQTRAEKWYADREAARIAYEKKTPAERALDEQSQLWNYNALIFLARVEKIKLHGKIYPQPEPKQPKRKAGKLPVPPPPVLMPVFPKFGESYQAYLRPIRWIKGPQDFSASWQQVGGMTSCGSSNDGSLAFSYPGDEIAVFANWASSSQLVQGQWVSSEYLRLYGIDRADLVEPRILAAITNDPANGNEPKK